jgi:hypothetical protein
VQARYLFRRLEFHLLGNHLLANAKALVFAGLYFQGKEADAWLEKGAKILTEQIPAQVLEDGGHFELTPMYHAIVLEDLLDLVNVTRAYVPGHDLAELCGKLIPGMVAWLDAMCHPDGQIAFFNDAALGIAPEPGDLKNYAGQLGFLQAGSAEQAGAPIPESGGTQLSEPGVTHLPESGYVRIQAGPLLLLADVGRVPASRTFEHCREWVRAGHRVTVMTCVPNFPNGRVYEGYKNKLVQTENMEGIDVIRVWSYITANEGFVKRILDYVSFMVSAVGAMKSSLIIRMLEKIEIFLYHHAVKIVSVTHSFKNTLIRRGVPGDKITVVTNGGDRFRFILLGNGARKAHLLEKAKEMDLDNVIFIDSVPKEDVAKY